MRWSAAIVILAACGSKAAPAGDDAAAPIDGAQAIDGAAIDGAQVADAAIDGAVATGTPAPAGGWPVSSRCALRSSAGCDIVEAEAWDRSYVARLSRDESETSRLRDGAGTVIATITTSNAWFSPWGLTALPDGGWVITGSTLGPSTLTVGAGAIDLPYAYNRVIVRVDGGAPTWHQAIEAQSDERTLVAARTDGSVVIAGSQIADTTIGAVTVPGPVWVYDFFVAATTPAGAWAWAIDLPSPASPLGDFAMDAMALGPQSEVIVDGALRGTLAVAGHSVTGPTAARATASENGVWLDLAAAP